MTAIAREELLARSRYERDAVTWLSFLSLGYLLFVESSLGPAMPDLRKELGISYTVASLHFTALAGGAVLAALRGDVIVRRLGRQRAFWLSVGGITAGALGIVLSPSVVGTIAGALIVGICGAVMNIVVQASLAEWHGEQRAIALAEVNVAASSGAILAAIAVGLFEHFDLGWRSAIGCAVLVAAVAGVAFRDVTFPRGLPRSAGHRRAEHQLPRLIWLLCIIGTLSTASEWGFAYWGADFFHQVIGFSVSASAIAMTGFFLAMVVGRIGGGWLAPRVEGYRFLLMAFGLASIGFPIFWLARTPELNIAGLAIVGLGISNVYPIVSTLATGVRPEDSDVVIARLMFTGASAILLAPFVLGVLGDLVGIEAAFGVLLPLLLGALFLVEATRRGWLSERTAAGS